MTSTETDERRAYRVHLAQVVSTVIDVDSAADYDDACEQAYQEAPSPTNSTNHGIDPSGEWVPTSVEDAETDEQVWSEPDPFGIPQPPDTSERPIMVFGSTTQSQGAQQGTYTLDIRDENDQKIMEVTLTPEQAWRMVQNQGPARGVGRVYR